MDRGESVKAAGVMDRPETDKRSLFIPGAGHNDLLEREPGKYMEAVAAFTGATGPGEGRIL
jgi:hypothetical protein